MDPARQRPFGRAGFEVTAFAFGTAPIGDSVRPIDDAALADLQPKGLIPERAPPPARTAAEVGA